MAEQSSRLHRLLTLLDTGSTQATRLAAARQIGDIAKLHPLELNSLIKKVSQFLRSRNWDTRVAAAHAFGSVAANVKHTTLKEMFAYVEAEALEIGMPDVAQTTAMAWPSIDPSTVAGLSFSSFDVNKVLEYGCALLASGGQEFDIVGDSSKNPVDRLAHQKKNLHRRLGLDICEQFMDVNEVIKDEDLVVPKGHPHGNAVAHVYYASSSGKNIQQLVANMVPSFRPKRLSARELNLLKRKAKINAKDQCKGLSEDDEFEGLQTRIPEKGSQVAPMVANKGSVEAFVAGEESQEENECGKWPFCDFVEQLIHDIFDPIWEIRHGAMMALREILSRQGGCAGVLKPDLGLDTIWIDDEDMNVSNAKKRIRQIDLNSQTTVDEHAPECKRIKAETDTEAYLSSCCLSKEVKVNNHSNVKVEPGLENGFHLVSKQEDPVQKPLPEEKNLSNMTFLADLPDSCELKRLIKLSRHSCLKNWEFLQDCAIRLLCVLSLDRFGDFVSDQVVAPVRETCAQSLGAVIKYMLPSMVHETLNVLLYMQCRQEWEVRHGCLLGVKYLVAVRKDMLDDLLVRVLPACQAGLQDPDDDVRAVAAEVLIPAASALASLEEHTLNSVVMLLWDILLDLDDLSPSTSSVMNLLAEIYSQPEMAPKILTSIGKQEFDLNRNSQDGAKYEENPYILSTLTPRLWPFMRHNITSVRHSAIRTMERLLEVFYESCSGLSDIGHWTAAILGDTLRIVFQNILLESDESILQCSERVWRLLVKSPKQDLEIAARSFFSSWVQLATTPVGSTLDAAKMFFPAALPRKSHFKAAAKMRAVKQNDYSGHALINFTKEYNLQEKNADVARIIVGADVEKSITRTRVDTAAALGIFASKLPEAALQVVIDALWNDLSSTSGFQRQVASMVLIAWFKELKSEDSSRRHQITGIVNPIRELLLKLLMCSNPSYPTKDSCLPYAELSKTYTKMRSEASILFHAAGLSGIFKNIVLNANLNLEKLSIDDAIGFGSKISLPTDKLNGDESNERKLLDDIEFSKQQLLSTSGYLKRLQNNLHVTVLALVAAAIIWISELPPRLNPVILPLTAAVKREKEEILQEKAAEALAELVHNCIGRKPSPNDKLIKNLCNLTWTDPCETPQAAIITSISVIDEQDLLSYEGAPSNKKAKVQVPPSSEDRSKLEGFISRRGSERALLYLCQKFGPTLFDKLPKLWECLTEILRPITSEDHSPADDKQALLPIDDCKDPQSLINNIQVVQSIASVVDAVLRPRMLTLLPCIFRCVRHSHVAVRLAASRCITSMAKSMKISVMTYVTENAIPMLGDLTSVDSRQGAGMLLSLLVQGLGMELVPYAPFLVVPLLRCMGDSNHIVRESVTRSFAALVPLLPLSRGIHTSVELCESLSRNSEDARFLEQLLDNSHIDDYKLPINLKVDLRRYQQEGINWLSFLRRFKLHGILCDDMGLGKTLQASAIVASDISEKGICSTSNNTLSLIICPSTLIGHWAYEIEKYIDDSIMIVLQYIGSAQERFCLVNNFDKYNVIITSYDIVRKDIDYLRKISWNYCILDEGHIIKNSKSKITSAVKQLKAEHRLILSGTPIQNNVLELWSLFDFLMPGFLGSERQFQATYGKPFLAAKNSKVSAKDAEAGVLAMEALHKQVMPFILRRTKDEVLSDLPEKIIQDRYCDLSPVQLKLYEQFSSSDAKREISDLVRTSQAPTITGRAIPAKATSHIFQALQYLLKLCSHPLLVLGQNPPATVLSHLADVLPGFSDASGDLHDLFHSPKLVALQEILEECGVGLDASSSENTASVGQHRVLIFSQHRAFLDIIERDLFQAHMKSVTYLRLDGSVEPEKRFDIVKSFNSDPTIDVLLLTTHVGGLGLNLASADTLVFMEHDWNPMKDLQAMDRAHRLGQRKVVNVHRIIMRGTLEEKVMNLQKFKMSVANAVINAENASLKTMNTEQLLDLFTPAQAIGKSMPLSNSSDGGLAEERKSVPGGKGLKAMLHGLEELWDHSQYTEEYDVNQFLAKLTG